jgi:hypothetical protein
VRTKNGPTGARVTFVFRSKILTYKVRLRKDYVEFFIQLARGARSRLLEEQPADAQVAFSRSPEAGQDRRTVGKTPLLRSCFWRVSRPLHAVTRSLRRPRR